MSKVQQVSNVGTPSTAYEEMRDYFTLCRDLLGGTRAFRKRATEYLPQHPAETQKAYEDRLRMSVLTPFFENLMWYYVGKVFARPVEVVNGPDEMKSWLDDVDLNGRHLRVFARDLFAESYAMGVGYIYVEAPRDLGETLRDAIVRRARPYLIHVPTENVIDIRTDDEGRVTMVRIIEHVSEWPFEDNEWEEVVVQRVRVIEPNRIRVYRQIEDETYELIEDMENPFGFVPLVPVFTGQRRDFVAKPAMAEIAYMNVAHYQFRSNHQNSLTVAQFPMLAASGVKEADKKSVTIGPRKLLRSDDPNAKFYYVEHTGAALDSGRKYIDDLAIEMVSHGIQLMRPKGGEHNPTTATEERIREVTALSSIQTVAYNLSNALEIALKMMAQIGGIAEDVYDSMQVIISGSYTLTVSDINEINTLVNMNLSDRLTLQSLFTELKRRGVLSDAFNINQELENLLIEGPLGEQIISDDADDSTQMTQGQENIVELQIDKASETMIDKKISNRPGVNRDVTANVESK